MTQQLKPASSVSRPPDDNSFPGPQKVVKKKSLRKKQHQKELARIRSQRSGNAPPITRELTKYFQDRREDSTSSRRSTFAFWETAHGSTLAAGQSNVEEYLSELENIDKRSCWKTFLDNTFENGLVLPNCWPKFFWDWAVIFMVLYNCIIIPLNISFGLKNQWLTLVDNVVNAMLIADMAIAFRTCYIDHRQNIVADKKKVVNQYLKTRFFVDLMGSLPFDLLASTFEFNKFVQDACVVLGLLRFGRLVSNQRLSGSPWNKPLVRIVVLCVGFLILAHWFGAVFFYVSVNQTESEFIGWVEEHGLKNASGEAQYVSSLYWAMTTMVTVGYGDISANTLAERLVNVPVLILSTLIYATIFGNVSYAVESMTSTFRRYQFKMDTVAEFTRLFQLPKALSDKLYGYTEEIFHQNKGFDMDALLGNLPSSVRADILIYLHPKIIESVPLFEGVTENFVEAMILKLKFFICLPDDYVFRENDKSKDMFFLRVGIVEVEMADRGVVGDLGPGAHFGDIAMLLGNKRTSSIRAVTKCELSYLTQDDFADLLFVFPEYEENVRAKAKKHVLRDVLNSRNENQYETSQTQARHEELFRQRTGGYRMGGEDWLSPDKKNNNKFAINEEDTNMSRMSASFMVNKFEAEGSVNYGGHVEEATPRKNLQIPIRSGGNPIASNLFETDIGSKSSMLAPDQTKTFEDDDFSKADSGDTNVVNETQMLARKRWSLLASLFGPQAKRPSLELTKQPLSILKSGGSLDLTPHRKRLDSHVQKRVEKQLWPKAKPLRPTSRQGFQTGETIDKELFNLAPSGSVFGKLQEMRGSVRGNSSRVIHQSWDQDFSTRLNDALYVMEARLEGTIKKKLEGINRKLDALAVSLSGEGGPAEQRTPSSNNNRHLGGAGGKLRAVPQQPKQQPVLPPINHQPQLMAFVQYDESGDTNPNAKRRWGLLASMFGPKRARNSVLPILSKVSQQGLHTGFLHAPVSSNGQFGTVNQFGHYQPRSSRSGQASRRPVSPSHSRRASRLLMSAAGMLDDEDDDDDAELASLIVTEGESVETDETWVHRKTQQKGIHITTVDEEVHVSVSRRQT